MLDDLRHDIVGSVVNPPDNKQSEFHFGRISGGMYYLGILEERLKDALEQQADLQRQREKDFD